MRRVRTDVVRVTENLTTAYKTVKRGVCETAQIPMKPASSPHVVSGIFSLAVSERDATLTHYVVVGGGVELSAGVWL